MYPQLYHVGLADYRCTINYSIQNIEGTYCDTPKMVSSQFEAVADSIRNMYSLPVPSSFEDGLELYFILIEVLGQYNLY